MIPLIIKDCLRRGIEAGVSEAVVVTGSPLVDCLGQARLSSLARRLSDYLGQARGLLATKLAGWGVVGNLRPRNLTLG